MGQGLEPTMATWEVLLVALRWSSARFRGRCSSSMPTVTSSGGDDMAGSGRRARPQRPEEGRRWTNRGQMRTEEVVVINMFSSHKWTHTQMISVLSFARPGLHKPAQGMFC